MRACVRVKAFAGACRCVSTPTCGGGPGRSASAASASPAAPPPAPPPPAPRSTSTSRAPVARLQRLPEARSASSCLLPSICTCREAAGARRCPVCAFCDALMLACVCTASLGVCCNAVRVPTHPPSKHTRSPPSWAGAHCMGGGGVPSGRRREAAANERRRLCVCLCVCACVRACVRVGPCDGVTRPQRHVISWSRCSTVPPLEFC